MTVIAGDEQIRAALADPALEALDAGPVKELLTRIAAGIREDGRSYGLSLEAYDKNHS